MRQLITIAVLALLAIAPGVASAELTATEKAEVKKLHLATSAYEAAFGPLSRMTLTTNAATRPAIYAFWHRYGLAWRDFGEAACLLIGANPESNTEPEWAVLQALPRAQWVARAWQFIDEGIASIEDAREFLPALPAGTDRTAIDKQVGAVLAQLDTLNRTLAFANPAPRVAPQIIGPHGNYSSSTNQSCRALRAMSSAVDEFRQAYGLGALLSSYTGVFDAFVRRAPFAQSAMRAWLLNTALIPLTTAQCAMNPFHLVVDGMLMATASSTTPGPLGAPNFWRMMDMHKIAPVVSQPTAWLHFARGLDLWNDSWKYGNNSIAWALRFPAPATLAQLRMQGFPASDPFAPPLCP